MKLTFPTACLWPVGEMDVLTTTVLETFPRKKFMLNCDKNDPSSVQLSELLTISPVWVPVWRAHVRGAAHLCQLRACVASEINTKWNISKVCFSCLVTSKCFLWKRAMSLWADSLSLLPPAVLIKHWSTQVAAGLQCTLSTNKSKYLSYLRHKTEKKHSIWNGFLKKQAANSWEKQKCCIFDGFLSLINWNNYNKSKW